jgi:arsenate reductase (thioredoxin)
VARLRARLLFVCVENANRSQMAEGFARALGAGRVEVASAGSHPAGAVSPRAVRFMKERGVDVAEQRPKALADLPAGGWDAVVTMGCGDACPRVPARLRLDWDLPDPREMDDEGFRAVRDRIEALVHDLIDAVTVPRAEEGSQR